MPAPDGLPLRHGSTGRMVRDLHRRLARAGFDAPSATALDRFTGATEEALVAFQRSRGLDATGVCDEETWSALVEASYSLGDRHLYLHVPYLRGDDVAELQMTLGRLGFDAGRIDGIFGPDTHRAVLDFQRNASLVTDGIVGRDTVEALHRLGGRSGSRPVAVVRERERLRGVSGTLAGRRVVVGDLGGAAPLSALVARILREHGADAMPLEQQAPSAHARRANEAGALAYVGLQVSPVDELLVAHFAVPGFESEGGRRLADGLRDRLAEVGVTSCTRRGLRLAVLRETRMPSVFVRMGPATTVVRRLPELGQAVASAVELWILSPVEDEPTGSSTG